MECIQIQNKMKLLFTKISSPGYTMDTYYADTFIKKILNNPDSEALCVTNMTILPDLLADTLENMKFYHNTVKVFIGRLLAIFMQKEINFSKIVFKKGDKLLECLNEIDAPGISASLRVAYMELALSLVSHTSGVHWMLETGLWKKIIGFKSTSTVFISRLMYKFTSEFVWKLNDLGDEANITSVIDYIWKPIQDLDLLNVVSYTIDFDTQEKVDITIEPSINMLISIVSRNDRCYTNNMLFKLMYRDHAIVTKFFVLLDKVRREETLMLINKLLFYLIFLRVFQMKPIGPDVEYNTDDFLDLKVLFFNTLHNILQKGKIKMLLDYCYVCNQSWFTVRNELQTQYGKTLELHSQFLFLSLVPLVVYIHKGTHEHIDDNMINDYVADLLNKACQHTARIGYQLREFIIKTGAMSEIIIQCVKRLTSLKDFLNDEQANIVFRALFFTLVSYAPKYDGCPYTENILAGEVDLEEYEKKVEVMTYVIEITNAIIKKYNINWQDSLEILCLNTIIHNILTKRSNLSCKFVVASLNLLNVIIQKFLPPNLSLLVDSTPGSAMSEIGSLINVKLHDMHWETRDSALELLHTCTEISFVKFPPIQKQLIEHKLLSVAVTMAHHDFEPYVQVAALRCVGAAVKVAPLWEQLKAEHANLLEELVMVLRNNQEGIVRKEACNVLCEVYQNEKLTPGFKQSLYNHMASTVMGDFHWEVQLTALKFWKIVIQSFLSDQGMLDGTFPPVTFSRNSRKIVTLNEPEIQKRLLIVLDELASIGCLTVLLKLINDDNDVDVMDAALAVSQELFAILQKYKIAEVIPKPARDEPRRVEDLLCDIKEDNIDSQENDHEMEAETSNKSDNVIQDILNEGDINLLADLYKKHMNLQHQVPNLSKAPRIKLLKTASPSLYVSFMATNKCSVIIKEKREWKDGIRSVSSLLDDVLGIYDLSNEVNTLDCY